MYRFMRRTGFVDYESLYEWSIGDSPLFWKALCEFCDVRFEREPDEVIVRPDNIMDAGWFAGSQLNYAEHLLRHKGDSAALVFYGEDGTRRELSRDELREQVAAIAAGLRAAGVGHGDRVGGYLPNCPEAVIAMLAATSIGAIWSSCSPDFGINGVVDRFGQIEPKVLFAANGYYYNGKTCDTRSIVEGVVDAVGSILCTVIIPFAHDLATDTSLVNGVPWQNFARRGEELTFTPVDFNHPLYIMYSSGTTGVPKCIVHGHGGTLLQHLKEHVLHTDIGTKDRLFYFTTCGWMMWNWLVSGLASGATLVLFDGSPFYNDGRVLWQMAETENVTVFGTSAKYISALEKAGVRPIDEFALPELRAVLSTGSPLAPESFDYVYDAIGKDLQLASISGGTDILSCFALGNPLLPVRRGELQCRGLGMAVQIWNDEGQPVVGEHGELVCTQPFPSTPVCFWNDADGARYKAAYFERADLDQRVSMLARASLQEKAASLDRASDLEKAAVFERATAAEKAAALERASAVEKAAVLDRAVSAEKSDVLERRSLERASFERMSAQEKASMLDRMTEVEKAAVLDRASAVEKAAVLDRFSMQEKGAALDRATAVEKGAVLGRASATEKAAMLDRATAVEKAACLERATAAEKASLLARASLDRQSAMLDRFSMSEKAAMLDRATDVEKASFFERASAAEKASVLGRASDAEKAAVLDRAVAAEAATLLARLSLERASFEKMSVQEKAAVLDRAAVAEKSAMLDRATAAEKAAFLDRATAVEKAAFLERASMQERSAMLGRATMQEKQSMFERALVE